ncbi:unnamed protein product, partial [Cyprideis torosa]
TKYQKFPGFACDIEVGNPTPGLRTTKCLAKAQRNQCWAVQTKPDCVCCQTVKQVNTTFVHAPAVEYLLGFPCALNDECDLTIIQSFCNSTTSTCECNAGYVEYTPTECIIPLNYLETCTDNQMSEKIIGDTCSVNEECTLTIALGICNGTLQCGCASGHFAYSDTECIAIIPYQGACTDSTMCAVSILNSDCIGSICECPSGYNYLDITVSCVPEMVLGSTCALTDECALTITGSFCNGNVCQCNAGLISYNDTFCMTKKIIGDPCTADAECLLTILNSVCNAGTCQCDTALVPYNTTSCMTPLELNDVCTNDQECQVSVDCSYCRSSDSKCQCKAECVEKIVSGVNICERPTTTTTTAAPVYGDGPRR